MTITADDLRPLAAACAIPDAASRSARIALGLGSLGDPPAAALLSAARDGTANADRNVRVAMLRVLRGIPELHAHPETRDIVIAALGDPKRRVREVAVRVAGSFVDDANVADAVRSVVENERETSRIRGIAFFVLSVPRAGSSPSTEIATSALAALSASNGYRKRVLRRLCYVPDPDEAVVGLLRDYVAVGTKDEAVDATRALCGYRLARLDDFDNAAARQWVSTHCERSQHDTREFWVPRRFPDLFDRD